MSTPADALRAIPGIDVVEHEGVPAEHPEPFPANELRAPDGTPGAMHVSLADETGSVLSDELRSTSRLIWLGDLPDAARTMIAEFDVLPRADGPIEIVVELPAGGPPTVDRARGGFGPGAGAGSARGGAVWVRTAMIVTQVPGVFPLWGYEKLPKQTVKFNRRNIFARDHNQCQYCGKKFVTNELSLDHVVPRSQGGGTSWDNIVCACVDCNVRKGGRTPRQANMTLIRKPEKPKRSPLLNLKLTQNKYRSWPSFLDNAYWSVELK